ncbi:glycoside hydrolase family 3 protein [Pseudarthrobacter niigatensis]|uniref:beta-glucosidase n=1 Tax=Pseudarthrobacter niigatensis TaxID=369935 RepID=A0AAJ1WC40_9MICC|nr:glycoside hydrolase family 3 N-terminal domain-containing protein [Pseudarthrobacter niigatensis]MDQ0144644.1 beta-glucosidase [Pseudarthrobacter niigatensis]MDQ0265290.1 beta-glucosidase [Pseudarthrobacter niigatensis]
MSIQVASEYMENPDGVVFRDLNGNGVMEPYEDPRLPAAERVEDLLGRLSLEEKAGLMFISIVSVPDSGNLEDETPRSGRVGVRDTVANKLVNHLNFHYVPVPNTAAKWVNELQRHALESSPHGIPVTLFTDPRHSFIENWGASFTAEYFSAWPEPLGLAAVRDEQLVREFATIARAEYTAIGIRGAMHPTIDLATEPRWARQYSTFGQDKDLVARLANAYLDGFQGPELGADSVECMAKHFPGGGPQLDGEDPHFPYGREQVYPGGMFDYHLEPFKKVIARGVSCIMPYYGMPVGLVLDGEPIEEVGFGFNRQIITGLLREKLGFDGVVCTDWSLITESRLNGKQLPPRAWGVEHLSVEERVLKVIEAGCDQFGGEECPEIIVDLVRKGLVQEERIDASVRRLLRVKFDLGLFDNPYVDAEAAAERAGRPEYVAAGELAQARSVTILKNDGAEHPLLPLAPGVRVYSEEMDPNVVAASGLEPVGSAGEADVAIVRVAAPFEFRDHYMLESSFHAGSLAFDTETIEKVRRLSEQVPVVLVPHLDRPAILTPLEPHCAAIAAVYGASDSALLKALTNVVPPEGRVPFQLPRSEAAVIGSRPDVPGDTEDPLYECGFGLEL